jgi:hypothetical protein
LAPKKKKDKKKKEKKRKKKARAMSENEIFFFKKNQTISTTVADVHIKSETRHKKKKHDQTISAMQI